MRLMANRPGQPLASRSDDSTHTSAQALVFEPAFRLSARSACRLRRAPRHRPGCMILMHRSVWIAVAFAIGFSPVLHDLFELLRTQPAQRYILLPLLLIGLLLYRRPELRHSPRNPVVGSLLLLLGLTTQLLGIACG